MTRHRIYALVFLLGIASALQAQGVTFRNVSWPELKRQAQAEKKAIFVDVYTSWCGPCKRMDREVFGKADVGRYMDLSLIHI